MTHRPNAITHTRNSGV